MTRKVDDGHHISPDEALLRQALEALEQIASDLPWELTALQVDTIAALRERLCEGVEKHKDEALLRQALEALIWTTGSEDFGEGGLAREGALKLLFPTISALRERLGEKA